MGMVVKTNMMAINANNALNRNNSTVAKNVEKLSTGMRINRAADDASGLAISEKMKAQIKALDTASANAEDGISLIQTAEGYMEEVHDMLNRIVELAEKSANGTYETKSMADGGADAEVFGDACTDRQALQDEVNQLCSEIDRIAKTANFNNLKVMDGTLATKFSADDLTKAAKGATDANMSIFEKATGNVTAGVTYYDKSGTAVDPADLPAAGVALPSGLFTKTNGIGKDATATDANATTVNDAIADGGFVMMDGKKLSGTAGGLKLQVGETSTTADKLTVTVMNFKTDELFKEVADFTNADGDTAVDALTQANDKSTNEDGLTINISNQDSASMAAEAVRQVIDKVSSQRAELGAQQNRLEYTINNLDTASENITAANSRIRDTDMAKEMMAYTQGNVLTQAAQAMLAQANQAPQGVLQLLQ